MSHSQTLEPSGFTLLEILVAVFIMAMVLTFAFEAYQGIEHAYSRVGSSPSRDRAARIVLDRLERELVGSVLVERAEGADPLLHPYFFSGEMKAYAESEGDTLRFVTRTPLRAPASPPVGLEIVTYGAVPSQSGPGLVLLRQAEVLPAQLAKDVVWDSPDIVVDNVALFLARYTAEDQQASETWDSTSTERLDQLPSALVVTVSLWETDAAGQAVQGAEFSRTIDLPVRPFKLAPEDTKKTADCGEGMTVQACVENFGPQISQSSQELASAIRDAQGQVQDTCWNPEQPSPALQRLKVLMGGIPGFDAGECK
jgi:general secretion pathway protein J